MTIGKLRRTVRRAAELLVARDFRGLAALSGGVRFSAAELEDAAADYDGPLALPSEDWLASITLTPEDAEAVRAGVEPHFFFDLSFWAPDGAPWPRLTLELLLSEAPGELYRVEVCDLYAEHAPPLDHRM